MLKQKELLVSDIQKYFNKIVFNTKKQNLIIDYCHEDFAYPEDLISDYLRGQKEIASANMEVLYCVAKAIDRNSKLSLVDEYFTSAEKSALQSYQYETQEIKFPIRFKMIPISSDSWIGPITAKELIALYQQQLINYNANTQRALKYVFRHGKSSYKIEVNKTAVQQIAELLKSGQYIPNTLTLNIPLDEEGNDFYYSTVTSELVINRINKFDILDGYHRLLAIFQVENSNSDFDYSMELRVTNYDENKAKQFIFQEDQKTKMKKIDSDAYNIYSHASRVINKLNTDPLSGIQGMISMNGEYISQSELNHIVHCLWFNKINQQEGRKIIPDVCRCLISAFNALTESNPDYLAKKWSYKELLSVGYYAYQLFNGSSYLDLGKRIVKLIQSMNEDSDIRLVPSKKITLALIKHIDSLVEAEG